MKYDFIIFPPGTSEARHSSINANQLHSESTTNISWKHATISVYESDSTELNGDDYEPESAEQDYFNSVLVHSTNFGPPTLTETTKCVFSKNLMIPGGMITTSEAL